MLFESKSGPRTPFRLNEREKDNPEEVAGGAPQAARSAHAGEGLDFYAPPRAGPHYSDSPLQSGMHLLQRIRRFLEAGADGRNVRAHRPPGRDGNVNHHD